MRKNFMYCLLFIAMGSCEKSSPVPDAVNAPTNAPSTETVPLPWRPAGVSPQSSTYNPMKQVDYTNPTPPTTPPAQGGCTKPDCPPKNGRNPIGGNGGGCKKDTVPTPPPIWE